jgi:hypothetical protein
MVLGLVINLSALDPGDDADVEEPLVPAVAGLAENRCQQNASNSESQHEEEKLLIAPSVRPSKTMQSRYSLLKIQCNDDLSDQ